MNETTTENTQDVTACPFCSQCPPFPAGWEHRPLKACDKHARTAASLEVHAEPSAPPTKGAFGEPWRNDRSAVWRSDGSYVLRGRSGRFACVKRATECVNALDGESVTALTDARAEAYRLRTALAALRADRLAVLSLCGTWQQDAPLTIRQAGRLAATCRTVAGAG